MARYDADRRSAYMGNLPIDMSEEELREMASSCGALVDVRLYNKTYPKSGPCESS